MSATLPLREPSPESRVVLNDVHSRLNRTGVAAVLRPRSVAAAQAIVRDASRHGHALALMGARHAMGGQQLLHEGRVVDTSALDRVCAFDPLRGLVTVEAGIRWPALLDWLARHPANRDGWTIRQKQTGADDFSLGGALASNIHGRGLAFPPFVDDVESIDLLDADGQPRRASREENATLFACIAGGYGLFGLVVRLTLRLVRRCILQREVRLIRSAALIPAFEDAIARGCRYGDFQFAIDAASDDFLDLGILSCYQPVADAAPEPSPRHLSPRDFARLLLGAHVEPSRAFAEYSAFYLASNGQRYASDAQQMGVYLGDYHAQIDAQVGHCGSEMISELYVPRSRLAAFLQRAAASLRRHRAQAVYGTVRLIERDVVSRLAWAREAWACVVFNLHVDHAPPGIARAQRVFRTLIDDALLFGGSFYLTYHRWATRAQLEAAYPQVHEFLREKRACDPRGRFQSDWYRALGALFEAPRHAG